MDTLTHIVIGAVSGKLIAGKQLGKKAMLFGALAANLPDLDGIMNFIVSDAESMLIHRGLSHSLIIALLVGPILGFLCSRFFDKKVPHAGSWILLITLNLIFHDLLDTCTMYGTGLLMPFINHRYSWDNIFVADPVFTIPLIVSALCLIFSKKENPNNRVVYSGIFMSLCYLIFTFYGHISAINNAKKVLKKNETGVSEIIAVPTLFNSVLWYVVVKQENNFLAGYYSVFDQTPIKFYGINKQADVENLISDSTSVNYLKKFSKGFYCYRIKNGKLFFNDLRFGQVNGWDDPESEFAFSFDLTPGANNKMVVQQGRVEGTRLPILKSMIKRMKGI